MRTSKIIFYNFFNFSKITNWFRKKRFFRQEKFIFFKPKILDLNKFNTLKKTVITKDFYDSNSFKKFSFHYQPQTIAVKKLQIKLFIDFLNKYPLVLKRPGKFKIFIDILKDWSYIKSNFFFKLKKKKLKCFKYLNFQTNLTLHLRTKAIVYNKLCSFYKVGKKFNWDITKNKPSFFVLKIKKKKKSSNNKDIEESKYKSPILKNFFVLWKNKSSHNLRADLLQKVFLNNQKIFNFVPFRRFFLYCIKNIRLNTLSFYKYFFFTFISRSRRNIFINFSNLLGQTLWKSSTGLFFKKSKRKTFFARDQVLANTCLSKIKESKKVCLDSCIILNIHGPIKGRGGFKRILKNFKFEALQQHEILNFIKKKTHNGVRKKKRRRK